MREHRGVRPRASPVRCGSRAAGERRVEAVHQRRASPRVDVPEAHHLGLGARHRQRAAEAQSRPRQRSASPTPVSHAGEHRELGSEESSGAGLERREDPLFARAPPRFAPASAIPGCAERARGAQRRPAPPRHRDRGPPRAPAPRSRQERGPVRRHVQHRRPMRGLDRPFRWRNHRARRRRAGPARRVDPAAQPLERQARLAASSASSRPNRALTSVDASGSPTGSSDRSNGLPALRERRGDAASSRSGCRAARSRRASGPGRGARSTTCSGPGVTMRRSPHGSSARRCAPW